jgi:hypothetical protein
MVYYKVVGRLFLEGKEAMKKAAIRGDVSITTKDASDDKRSTRTNAV